MTVKAKLFNNKGLFSKWLVTVHSVLNYILIKSVGLGPCACNYDPLCHMLDDYCRLLFNKEVMYGIGDFLSLSVLVIAGFNVSSTDLVLTVSV